MCISILGTQQLDSEVFAGYSKEVFSICYHFIYPVEGSFFILNISYLMNMTLKAAKNGSLHAA